MNNILYEIISYKRKEINQLKKEFSKVNLLKREKKIHYFSQNFKGNKVKIIAEIKPSSPSEGMIISPDRIVEIVKIYSSYEIAGISVLTDRKYFNGDYKNLEIVSNYTNKPVLCKEFIIDKFQIDLAYYFGADAILLIIEALTEKELIELYEYAQSLNLEILVEFHNEKNIDIINRNNFKIVGINNRNLDTMKVDIRNSIRLRDKIKRDDIILISESGIYKKEDLRLLEKYNFHGALIGTSILKSKNLRNKLNELVNYNKEEGV